MLLKIITNGYGFVFKLMQHLTVKQHHITNKHKFGVLSAGLWLHWF